MNKRLTVMARFMIALIAVFVVGGCGDPVGHSRSTDQIMRHLPPQFVIVAPDSLRVSDDSDPEVASAYMSASTTSNGQSDDTSDAFSELRGQIRETEWWLEDALIFVFKVDRMVGTAFQLGTPSTGVFELVYSRDFIVAVKELSLQFSWMSEEKREEYWNGLDAILIGCEARDEPCLEPFAFEYKPTIGDSYDHELLLDISDDESDQKWIVSWDSAGNNLKLISQWKDKESNDSGGSEYTYDHDAGMVTFREFEESEYERTLVMIEVRDPELRAKNGVCISYDFAGFDNSSNQQAYSTSGYADNSGGTIEITVDGSGPVQFTFDAEGNATTAVFDVICD